MLESVGNMEDKDFVEVPGVVTEALPNLTFRVQLENEHLVLAKLAGKMQKNRIRVLIGDRVLIQLPIIDLSKGRIVRRLT